MSNRTTPSRPAATAVPSPRTTIVALTPAGTSIVCCVVRVTGSRTRRGPSWEPASSAPSGPVAKALPVTTTVSGSAGRPGALARRSPVRRSYRSMRASVPIDTTIALPSALSWASSTHPGTVKGSPTIAPDATSWMAIVVWSPVSVLCRSSCARRRESAAGTSSANGSSACPTNVSGTPSSPVSRSYGRRRPSWPVRKAVSPSGSTMPDAPLSASNRRVSSRPSSAVSIVSNAERVRGLPSRRKASTARRAAASRWVACSASARPTRASTRAARSACRAAVAWRSARSPWRTASSPATRATTSATPTPARRRRRRRADRAAASRSESRAARPASRKARSTAVTSRPSPSIASSAASSRAPRYNSLSDRPPSSQARAAPARCCSCASHARSSSTHRASRSQRSISASWATSTVGSLESWSRSTTRRRAATKASATLLAAGDNSPSRARRRVSGPSPPAVTSLSNSARVAPTVSSPSSAITASARRATAPVIPPSEDWAPRVTVASTRRSYNSARVNWRSGSDPGWAFAPARSSATTPSSK